MGTFRFADIAESGTICFYKYQERLFFSEKGCPHRCDPARKYKLLKNIQVEGNSTAQLSVNKNDFAQMVINNPKLWWPNGYGDPNLYTCKLTCSIDGKVSDEKEVTFGIKKYEYKMINNVVNYPVMTFL